MYACVFRAPRVFTSKQTIHVHRYVSEFSGNVFFAHVYVIGMCLYVCVCMDVLRDECVSFSLFPSDLDGGFYSVYCVCWVILRLTHVYNRTMCAVYWT